MSDNNKELIAWAQRQLSLYADAPDGNYVKAKWKQIVAALEADKQGEPVALMYQHDESARTTFISAGEDAIQWEQNNPRWKFVCPCYTRPQPIDRKAIEDEVIERCMNAVESIDDNGNSYRAIRALKGSK